MILLVFSQTSKEIVFYGEAFDFEVLMGQEKEPSENGEMPEIEDLDISVVPITFLIEDILKKHPDAVFTLTNDTDLLTYMANNGYFPTRIVCPEDVSTLENLPTLKKF